MPQVTPGYFATIKLLLKLVWRVSPPFFLTLAGLTLLSGLLSVATILISSALLEALVQTVSLANSSMALPNTIVLLLILTGSVSLLGQFLGHLNEAVHRLYQTRVTNHVQLLIAEKASSLDLAIFENPQFHNQLQIAFHEASFRPLTIVQQLMQAISTLATLVTVTMIVVIWQAWMVPVILFTSLVTLWVTARFGQAQVNLIVGRAETERKAQYFQFLLNGQWTAKEIRLFGLRHFFLRNLKRLLEIVYQQDRKFAYRKILSVGIVETVLFLANPLLISFTALQALQGVISIGQFSLYTQSITSLQNNLNSLTAILGQLHENNLYVTNLFSFLALQPDVEATRPTAVSLPQTMSPIIPHIAFEDVSFQYPDTNQMVIENLSFEVRPGETIALVGQNGAGKTTIIKLLTGLYEPTAGRILFDGVDIKTMEREVLRSYLSVIFQDYTIYHFSAYDNIGIGRVDMIYDRTRVENAAQRSGLERVIATLPHGYDTVLGRFFEQGHELSGGQQQLMALARALMRDAPIVVLDEPTAALDIYTEQRFFRRLLDERGARTQTVFFISHRFTTVRRANRILVLEQGKLIEQGTHDELMALQGRYADMFTSQLQLYGDPAVSRAKTRERLKAYQTP